jgi:hypothetical protein
MSMIRWFCPRCHAESSLATSRCPACGALDDGSFDTRLRRALRHRIPETAAFAATVLANRGCRDAIPELLDLSLAGEPMRVEAALEALGSFLDDDRVRKRLHEARVNGTARERRIAGRLLVE